MKTIEVMYEGKLEPVELDDDLNFGAIEDIQAKYVNVKNAMSGGAEIDIVNYRYAVTLACVKSAPWKINDLLALKDLKRAVGKQVVKEATKLYPLRECLLEWMSTVSGELSEEQLALVESLSKSK